VLRTAFSHTGSRYEFLHCYHRLVELQKRGMLRTSEEVHGDAAAPASPVPEVETADDHAEADAG
jgi:hypothetical protein